MQMRNKYMKVIEFRCQKQISTKIFQMRKQVKMEQNSRGVLFALRISWIVCLSTPSTSKSFLSKKIPADSSGSSIVLERVISPGNVNIYTVYSLIRGRPLSIFVSIYEREIVNVYYSVQLRRSANGQYSRIIFIMLHFDVYYMYLRPEIL